MSVILDEMANALTLALKPGNGEPLLTRVARYDRHLRQSGFFQKCDEEEKQWLRQQRQEAKQAQKSKGFRDKWHTSN